VTGRAKPMVNVDGKKVSPAEVEACLRGHPGVAEALVVAGGNAQEGEWVKAVVVPLGQVTAMELREHCARSLAAFKVPRQVVFARDLSSGLMQKPSATAPEQDPGEGP
jgi:acyl-coenzyme A synthetase/AMP-(fatty) acid ligase